MEKKKLIVGSLILVAVCGLVVWPVIVRLVEHQKYANGPQPFAVSHHKSAEWQARAKLFDKNKLSATAIFAGATQVESFRLFPDGQEKPIGKTKNFSYFAKGATQDKRFATRLGTLILDAKTYTWPGQSIKQCSFEPGIAFRIWKNAEFVDTIICFHCSQLAVLENNPKVPQRSIGGSLQGRFYVAGDFDSAHAQLVVLAKEAFPNDTEIQALR